MNISARYVVPDPIATWEARTSDGSSFIVRRHGNLDGPAMLVGHGNGFAADAYFPLWSRFADRFDIYIHDVRNHGWNPVGERRRHHVPQFVDDLACVIRSIDWRIGYEKPRIGVFHSLSAMVALRHAAGGAHYAALVLFDPPVCPPGGLPADIEGVGARLSAMTLNRQETFDSPVELARSMSRSPMFARVRPAVVDLLARTTVRCRADGSGYELRCPREYEAQVFEYFFIWSMTVDFEAVTCPVKVIGSDPKVRNSFMPSMDLSELVRLDYDFLPEASHLLQFEQPEECAERTFESLAGHVLV